MQSNEPILMNTEISQDQMQGWYEEFWESIYRYILVRVGHVETAEDLTSIVFIEFFKFVQKNISKEHHYRGLIYTIARSEISEYFRKNNRSIAIDIEEIDIVDDQPFMDDQVDDTLKIENLTSVMKELSESHRELVTLRYIHQLEYSEIAQVLKKPEGTVRVAVHRALKTLKDKMNPQ